LHPKILWIHGDGRLRRVQCGSSCSGRRYDKDERNLQGVLAQAAAQLSQQGRVRLIGVYFIVPTQEQHSGSRVHTCTASGHLDVDYACA
jgi:hypothetical protein